MASMYSDQISEEMSTENKDNIETLKGHGASRDVTEMEGYDPHQRLGTETNFARDVAAGGASRSVSTGGHVVDDIRGNLPEMLRENNLAAAVANDPNGSQNAPFFIVNAPAARVNTSALVVAGTAVRFVFDSVERLSVVIVNTDSVDTLYIGGNSAVTIYNGFPILPGASVTLAANCELWAIATAANPASLAVIEFLTK